MKNQLDATGLFVSLDDTSSALMIVWILVAETEISLVSKCNAVRVIDFAIKIVYL